MVNYGLPFPIRKFSGQNCHLFTVAALDRGFEIFGEVSELRDAY
jgi:hypothetical protein